MGVYVEVNMCIARSEPLSIDQRVAVVELAIEHQLITKHCQVTVQQPIPNRGVLDAIKYLFVARPMYGEVVEQGQPGPWIATRMRALSCDVNVSSGFPWWKGEELTGPFTYSCTQKPKPVEVVNLYRRPEERSPHEPPDGVIGRFCDVLSVHAKRGIDARSAASSAFVKELKKLTGAKVICRTSWV